MPANALPAIHPGEIIREDILPSAGLSVTRAAELLGIPSQQLRAVLGGRRPLSADLCRKVSRLFGSSPEMWMRLQAEYGRKAAREKRVPRTNRTQLRRSPRVSAAGPAGCLDGRVSPVAPVASFAS